MGSDPFDEQRVRQDAALKRCLALPVIAQKACAAAVGGGTAGVQDPSGVPGLKRLPRVSLPMPNPQIDPKALLPNPMAQFHVYTGKEAPNLAQMDPPFTPPAGAPALLERAATGLRGERDGSAATVPPHADALLQLESSLHADPSVGGEGGDEAEEADAQRSAGAGDIQTLADLPICVNEGSRRFIYSLFRAVVGSAGDIECSDIAAG